MKKIVFLAAALLLASSSSGRVFAQDAAAVPAPAPAEETKAADTTAVPPPISVAPAPLVTTTVAPKEDDNNYVPITYANLSKMYWAVGKFKPDDNIAVDNYMLINECALYKQYYNNELEWGEVRKAARQSILMNKNKFPTKFYVDFPITLGKYDLSTKEFYISDKFALVDMRRLSIENSDDVGTGAEPFPCGSKGLIAEYPLFLITIFSDPITLTKIPVDQRISELYIDSIERYASKLDPTEQVKYMTARPAYLRMKMKMNQFKEEGRLPGTTSIYQRAFVLASMEKIEIYADKEMTKMLFEKDYRKSWRKARHHRKADTEEDVVVPSKDDAPAAAADDGKEEEGKSSSGSEDAPDESNPGRFE